MMTRTDANVLLLGTGALVALYVFGQIKSSLTLPPGAFNPADPNNLINQAATSIYQTVTGSDGSIGGDWYDTTHPVTARNVPNMPGYDSSKPATDSAGNVLGYADQFKSWFGWTPP